jgi:hypothetical protein
MPHIAKINLKSCGLTHESLDVILGNLSESSAANKTSSSSSLVSLNLSGNNLEGLSNMGRFLAKGSCSGALEVLKLSNCKLGDNELKQLSHGLKINKTLRILDLS